MYKRIKPLIIALPALFALGCGDAVLDPADEAELAALEDDSLEVAAPEQAPLEASLAEQLAAHPSFAQFNYLAWTRVQETLLATSSLSLAEMEVEAEIMNECDNGRRTLQACTNEAYAMGFEPLRSGTEAELGQQLDAAFGLNELNPRQRTLLFRSAREAYEANGGPTPGLNFVPDTIGGVACDTICKQTILAKSAGPQAQTMAWFASDGGGQEGASGSKWIWDIIEVVVVLSLECLFDPDCGPSGGGGSNECTSDSDCSSTEYCWKGPLGIGSNECRSKKQDGEACSRDGKCLSGCCNFNLFGSKCAEPSKCN